MKRNNNARSNPTSGSPVDQTTRWEGSAVRGTATTSNKLRKLQGSVGGKDATNRENNVEIQDDFPKLDQSNPVHARRIQQRRRMVAFGKNTVGYDEYMKKVPKDQRRPRCMKHPSTPDHTLDIPTKRWQGLIRAWRRALHQYDPPDMMKALNEEALNKDEADCQASTEISVKGRQLLEATEQRLPVVILEKCSTEHKQSYSPFSLATFVSSETNESICVTQNEMEELEIWEQDRPNDGYLSEDSDDDLL